MNEKRKLIRVRIYYNGIEVDDCIVSDGFYTDIETEYTENGYTILMYYEYTKDDSEIL